MVQFQNLYYDAFLKQFKNKKVIAYGTGGTLCDFLEVQKEKTELLEQIECLVDRDPAKKGMEIQIGKRILSVQSPDDFRDTDSMAEEYLMILFLADRYVMDALKMLDQIRAFDGMVCLYGLNSFNWGREMFYPPYPVRPVLPVSTGKYEIPARIHYCWFGGKTIPKENQKCIDSWHRQCPNYEFVLWDESKLNLNQMPDYVQEAYRSGRYAFVSDYVRLKAVYEQGGFYLDTDVLLLRPLEELRDYRSVYAFMEYGEIATGLGFGSIPGVQEIGEMLRLYDKIPFSDARGNVNLTPCPRYTNDFFRRRNVRIDNSLQLVEDMLFLPSSYFCPLVAVACEDGTYGIALYALEEHTIAIHLCDNSWRTKEDRAAFEKKKGELSAINARLLEDWRIRNREL